MKKIILLFALICLSGSLKAQDMYKYEFGVAVRDSILEASALIDSGFIREDSIYTIPPHNFSDNYPVIQFLYDAFAGSKFVFSDLTDEKILISIKFVFNRLDGYAPSFFDERLFMVMRVNVFKMPGRIPVVGDFIFKPGSFIAYILPKNDNLLEVFKRLNLNKDDLGFAYIRDARFDGIGIETINTPNDVRFRATHFSKFGGGRGQITGTTDVKDAITIPTAFKLYQNSPNPFNPSTKIKYTIPIVNKALQSSGSQFVSLKVYDLLGREVAELVNENQSPGTYEVEFNAEGLSSGIYLYRLTSGNFTGTRKLILMK